jgi:hypothetical protein
MARIRQKLDRAEWAKLSQDMQALYVERGESYVLDSDDAEELRTAFDRQKAELSTAKAKLAEFGDGDAKEFQRLKEEAAKVQRDKDIEKGNWEKIRAEDERAHKEALTKAADRELRIKAQLEESLVDGEITRAIAKYPGAKVTPLLLGAKQSIKATEIGGKLRAVVLDEKGEPRLRAGAKTTDDYMTPEDRVTEMRNDKEWAGNFPATNVVPPGKFVGAAPNTQSSGKSDLIKRLAAEVGSGVDRVGS